MILIGYEAALLRVPNKKHLSTKVIQKGAGQSLSGQKFE